MNDTNQASEPFSIAGSEVFGSNASGSSRSTEVKENESGNHSASGTRDGTASEEASLEEIGATIAVSRSKTIFFIVLLFVTGVTGFITYRFLKNDETQVIASQFEVLAQEVITISALNALHIFELYKAEALQFTSTAILSGQMWPYVAIPYFESEAALLMNQTHTGKFMALHPLVEQSQRTEWESWSVENQGWLLESYAQRELDDAPPAICPVISQTPGECEPDESIEETYLAPLWQISPVGNGTNESLMNYNGFGWRDFKRSFQIMREEGSPVLSEAYNLDEQYGWPESMLFTPVREDVRHDSRVAAIISAVVPWAEFFVNVLPEDELGIVVVVTDDVQAFTFEINGPEVVYVGSGDLHESEYDDIQIESEFVLIDGNKVIRLGHTLQIYPSEVYVDSHTEGKPLLYTMGIVFVFVLTSAVFLFYDSMVEKRKKAVTDSAKKTEAIVSSLFPKNVRDRLMNEGAHATNEKRKEKQLLSPLSRFGQGRNGLDMSSMPIADLFPESTVLFADISGFTAWSSVREPAQVFSLLESIYKEFDKIARRLKVFKVETIGDCYVAVTGVPEPMKDHAVVMCRFARECLLKMTKLVFKLEYSLGPGTSNLRMRFGMHSGPVTGGVLRGDRSRFQLFGDTVNTAARMESTGLRDHIQISQSTYDFLTAAGKSEWAKPREGTVFAKGKGEMQTYMLETKSNAASGDAGSASDSKTGNATETADPTESGSLTSEMDSSQDTKKDETIQRLILWNVENLLGPLGKIVASRVYTRPSKEDFKSTDHWLELKIQVEEGATVLDEVKEIIEVPSRPPCDDLELGVSAAVEIEVVEQLIDYVTKISSMYNQNSFHCFAHASHVTQSVTKLLSCVVTPDSIDYDAMCYTRRNTHREMHEYTYGIATDPLTQFAVVLSALIHDVDHPGVSNAQLVKEGTEMAVQYGNKSVAEQNSVDLAWDLLMEPHYEQLRRAIYQTQEELDRFRQLVVNAVMATDVMDKELGALRKKHWEMAFHPTADESPETMSNRKATIVIEHMIQASDVCHTMQHWHIYIDWNERLFHECYKAFLDGRAETDPSVNWYNGELGFFDFYVIPLAKKLKECGVFGVSSDEFLTYARNNREEWARRGHEVVQTYMKRYEKEQAS